MAPSQPPSKGAARAAHSFMPNVDSDAAVIQ